ncbi:MAG: GspE/PulE family protein [Planctomycetales bacterium]|nr:GspE/PulE family protein [Planctomycetales bacterium]
MKLGEILLRNGRISEAQLRAALELQRERGGRIGHVLVQMGAANEESVARALAEQSGMDYVDLAATPADPALLREIPPRLLHRFGVVPLSRDDGTITVAIADPLAVSALDDLQVLTRCRVRAVLARERDIQKVLRDTLGLGADAVQEMIQEKASDVEVLREEKAEAGESLELVEDAALVKLVNQVFLEALKERASDIHVEPFEDELRIRYRIDGVLHKTVMPPEVRKFQAAIISRLKIMANLNIAEKRVPQDGRIKLKVHGREIDVRVSVIPTLLGEGIVLRLLDRQSILFGLGELGMASDTLTLWERLIEEPYGILLVTGPTGSGKTTSLYAALQKINSMDQKIITIEDPVEYLLPGVNQIQVRPKVGLDFAKGLRHILRHDPDIVMIGEIRDRETAEIAVQASLTGHLVFSTLHTNDAPSAVTRLVDMGVEPYLIASSVEGLMAQRLVRTVCRRCRVEEPPPDRAALARYVGDEEVAAVRVLARGTGCEECRFTGYRGRIGIFELFRVTEKVKELIMERATANRIRREAVGAGMRTLLLDGWRLVKEGKTTFDEVLRVAKVEEA